MNLGDFDLLNPLDGYFGQLFNGPMHRFSFLADAGFSGLEIEKMLRRYGIRVWGRNMDDPAEHSFLVKETQAEWAEYLLCRAGVPLTGQLLDPRNETYRNQHAPGSMPKPWTANGIGAHSLVDHIVDWIEALMR
jgi:hypothetical protein